MKLQMSSCLGSSFSSPSQQARVITESWMADQGYCPACLARLTPTATNFKAVDFQCLECTVQFQLKSTKSKIGRRVPDGAYETMLSAVRSDTCPALVLMHYSNLEWTVHDLIIIPSFALTEQAIIPRKPLASTARRAGWIGCNIDLMQIAPQARVDVVKKGIVSPQKEVAASYARLAPLKSINVRQRGWAMAVLNGIQSSGWTRFTTQEAYQLEDTMKRIFPDNRNIRPKIRQQLQVLRDMGILIHGGRGEWMLPGQNISSSTQNN